MKKTLSVCLALLMLLSCFAVPTTAFAAAPKKPTVSPSAPVQLPLPSSGRRSAA